MQNKLQIKYYSLALALILTVIGIPSALAMDVVFLDSEDLSELFMKRKKISPHMIGASGGASKVNIGTSSRLSEKDYTPFSIEVVNPNPSSNTIMHSMSRSGDRPGKEDQVGADIPVGNMTYILLFCLVTLYFFYTYKKNRLNRGFHWLNRANK